VGHLGNSYQFRSISLTPRADDWLPRPARPSLGHTSEDSIIPSRARGRACWIGAAWLLALSGCAKAPYRYSQFHDAHSPNDAPSDVVIVRGTPNKTLDRIGNIVGFPARILPLNSKINDHRIAPDTEQKLTDYMERNDLTDVTVFVNHYDPKDQWRRLRDNKLIGAGWRYTLGSISVIGYTVLPGRIFGGDRYNPFTNSLYLNSDVPAVALREAAYAKDVHSHRLPGTYASIQELPVVGLWSDGRAVGDVIGYARDQQDWEVEKQAYHVLFPQLGVASTAIGGSILSSVWWGGPAFSAGGAAVGHIAGRTLAKREAAKHKESDPPTDPPTAEVQQAGYLDRKSHPSPPEDPPLSRLPPP
jgi:hypothetical protein